MPKKRDKDFIEKSSALLKNLSCAKKSGKSETRESRGRMKSPEQGEQWEEDGEEWDRVMPYDEFDTEK